MSMPVSELHIPRPIDLMARLISIIFHPLLVGVYMAAYLVYINPYYYVYLPKAQGFFNLITVVNNNFFFPMLVVLLMRGLGFSQSIYLKTTRERIVPYMASIIFFFVTWNAFYHKPEVPQVMKDMCQGIFYASIVGMIANIYFKISMHAIGVGGLVGLMIIVLMDGQLYSGLPMAISLLIAGLVMSSRLLVSDHKPGDILSGFVAGLFCQMIAAWIL
jgi:hypothetical protein